ncbi:hypothetical protein [Arthrobacter mobilis]|uniref:Uncharacterized protein n=1 Tax=Arthrobacter mobilis TaxID=2724944 RepID=A0A7X6HG68_9MICC|nr:hypothetical protein [Arthrobacter mobilis]NKX55431.1 hypothetical protein [Arthrobacter mobilis]
MSDDLVWQIFLVLAAGGTLLGFLVRSLLRYRGWWTTALDGRAAPPEDGTGKHR